MISHIPVEAKWVSLLTQGKHFYGVAADDAHHYSELSDKKANPGRGWIMVKSGVLNPDSITAAMSRGEFYFSSGVILESVETSPEAYHVVIDKEGTWNELRRIASVERLSIDDTDFHIEFIGKGGSILHAVQGLAAVYYLQGNEPYVRARITISYPDRGDNKAKSMAWTQPVFMN